MLFRITLILDSFNTFITYSRMILLGTYFRRIKVKIFYKHRASCSVQLTKRQESFCGHCANLQVARVLMHYYSDGDIMMQNCVLGLTNQSPFSAHISILHMHANIVSCIMATFGSNAN